MKSLLAVFAGGVLGTAARLFFDYAVPHGDTGFPLSTLIINVVGSGLLGFLVARVWPSAAPWLRAGLGAGVLGSFTTFSAVVVAVVTLTDGGRMLLAALYLALSLVLGFAAAAAGLRIGTSVAPQTLSTQSRTARQSPPSPTAPHPARQAPPTAPHPARQAPPTAPHPARQAPPTPAAPHTPPTPTARPTPTAPHTPLQTPPTPPAAQEDQ